MVRLIPAVCIAFVFAGWQAQEVTGHPIIATIELGQMAYDIYEKVKGIVQYFTADKPSEISETDLMFTDKLDNIAKNMERFEDRLFQTIEKALPDLFITSSNDYYLAENYINIHYQPFSELIKDLNFKNKTNTELDSLAAFFKSHKKFTEDEAKEQIRKMHYALGINNKQRKTNMLHLVASEMIPRLPCEKNQSPQQIITELYNGAVLTNLKALSMILMQRQLENGTEAEAANKIDEFQKNINDLRNVTLQYVGSANRQFWKCDLSRDKTGAQYSKVQEVFQEIITNERDTKDETCGFSKCSDMNLNKEGTKLRPYYRGTTTFAYYMKKKQLDCPGQLLECQDTSPLTKFCVAPREDDRRYLGALGHKKFGDYDPECEGHDKAKSVRKDFLDCSFCLCTCVSNEIHIDRYFSYEPATSDIFHGMVVVGVQLVKVNHVFYIEIIEGKLLPNGGIGSVRQKKIPANKTIDFDKIYRENDKAHWNESPINQDVYSVNWDQKTVFLDDLEAEDENLVLTGLRFERQNDALKLAIRLSPFDYETGTILEEGHWKSENANKKRTPVRLIKPDDPMKKPGQLFINSHSNQFVKFQKTDLEANFGQYTVPFLDTQRVLTNPPTPLVGAGLYHKSTANGESGGFLGLKLMQYDFSKRF